MDLTAVIRVALRALGRNKMRTVLTMLGIIIGVGAVICTVAIGEGASNQVQEQIRNLGDNMVVVHAGNRTVNGIRMGMEATKTLTVEDAKAIQQQVPLLKEVSPEVTANVQVVYKDQNWFTHVRGVYPTYLDIRHWPLVEGSAFTQADVTTSADVCLIGQTVAQNLFGDQDPVGKEIRVNNLPFRVIGELDAKGQSPFGNDQDDVLIMPLSTVQKKILGINWVTIVISSATNQAAIHPAIQQIEALLRQRHHLRADEDDDFIIRSPDDLAQARAQSGQIMTLLLASIASVSLLVGGIGIMNIMLVSVTERTREIGVRMAVGATEQDVQWQFLSEALVLSLLGGAVGVLLGVIGSDAVSRMLHWPVSIPPEAIFVAVFFAAAVGVFFGYYPARKAGGLDPINALRYE